MTKSESSRYFGRKKRMQRRIAKEKWQSRSFFDLFLELCLASKPEVYCRNAVEFVMIVSLS
jgi:hypothetical protein